MRCLHSTHSEACPHGAAQHSDCTHCQGLKAARVAVHLELILAAWEAEVRHKEGLLPPRHTHTTTPDGSSPLKALLYRKGKGGPGDRGWGPRGTERGWGAPRVMASFQATCSWKLRSCSAHSSWSSVSSSSCSSRRRLVCLADTLDE